MLAPQAYVSIKQLWLGTKGEGYSVLLAAMWMTKWKKRGRRKGRVVLIGAWKDASQIQMGREEDEGHSKLGAGQEHINPKC